MRSFGNWKFIVASASFAMIVSVLSSAARGVGFGTVVLRAFVGGIAFSVLAFFALALIDRYFPEFRKAAGGAGETAETGGAIDITIDEENPHDDLAELDAVRELQNAPSDGMDEPGEIGDDRPGEQTFEPPESDDTASLFAVDVDDVSAESDENVDDVEEIEPIGPQDEFGGVSEEPVHGGAQDSIENIGQSAGQSASQLAGQSGDGSVEIDSSENTGEPRFDGLDTFDDGLDAPVVARNRKLDLMGAEEEPEAIAKAVRTLMNRDQEG